ncbi:MAG: hypothetical protein ACJ778_12620 [Chloroflexota bacterium]
MTIELIGWLAGSARFRTFAETYRDKIHKKLRNATDSDTARDVRAELQVARLLLADRRFEVSFEAYGSGKVGPDLTVSFRSTRTFDVEVTRLRRVPDAVGTGNAVMAKLRQLTPSTPNVLLLSIDADTAAGVDVRAATRALRARADAKDEAFFTGRGFDGSRGFYDRFLRLSAVLVWCERATGEARASLWGNRSARIALPDQVARACLACLHAS